MHRVNQLPEDQRAPYTSTADLTSAELAALVAQAIERTTRSSWGATASWRPLDMLLMVVLYWPLDKGQ